MSRLSKLDLLHLSLPIGRSILQHFRKKTLLGILGYERLEADMGGVWLSLNELPRRKQRGIKDFKFCHSALDAESSPVFWIPASAGMTNSPQAAGNTTRRDSKKEVEKSSQPLFFPDALDQAENRY